MEVDKVEDIAHLHLIEVDGERVVMFLRGDAIDEDMLLAAVNHEVVDKEMLFVVNDIGGLDFPYAILQYNV